MPGLGIQPFPSRRTGGTGGFSLPGLFDRGPDQSHEPLKALKFVFVLATEILRLDNNHPAPGDALITECHELLFIPLWQIRGLNIKPKVNSRRDFVHILPPRSLGSDGLDSHWFQESKPYLKFSALESRLLSALLVYIYT